MTDLPEYPQWMTAKLIDNHNPDDAPEEHYLAHFHRGEEEAGIVAAGKPGYAGTLCLNEVYEDKDGQLHLSRTATWTCSAEELRALQRTGKLTISRQSGNHWRYEMIPA